MPLKERSFPTVNPAAYKALRELTLRVREPKVELTCRLLRFVPGELRDAARRKINSARLTVNTATVFVQREDEPRPRKPVGAPPQQGYPRNLAPLWVYNPGLRSWAFYQIRPTLLKIVQNLLNGTMNPENLDFDVAEALHHAHIVSTRQESRIREARWCGDVVKARDHLMSHGYTVVRNVVSPMMLANLRQYLRDQKNHGHLLKAESDGVASARFCRHNDVLMQFVHKQTGYLARKITGRQIYPSYNFLSLYPRGAQLFRHRDRAQCEWNASLMLDARPEIEASIWPLFLETKKGEFKAHAGMGDMILYRGSDLIHWREPLITHDQQTFCLFHYVPLDFTGDLN